MMCCLHTTPANAETVVRIATGEFPPYTSKNLPHGGVATKILVEAFALENIQADFHYLPWKRAYEQTAEGLYDGSLPWLDRKERHELFYYSDSIFISSPVVFRRHDVEIEWSTFSDLASLNIGLSLGHLWIDEMREQVQKAGGTIQTAPNIVLNFKKLLSGRIDVFISNKDVGQYTLNKFFSSKEAQQLVQDPTLLFPGGYHLIISKQIPNGKILIEKFNAGLKKYKASREYDEYLLEAFKELGVSIQSDHTHDPKEQ